MPMQDLANVNSHPRPRPFALIVLDGFGCRAERDWNAIKQARTPCFDRLFGGQAWTTVEASGLRVGLPAGQMGNSEVGHLNIGAGRVVDQDIVRISKASQAGELARNSTLVTMFDRLKKSGGAVHFAGLLSDGGVHSLQEHLHGLIDAALACGMTARDGQPRIFIHAILDGRDTPPKSAIEYVKRLLSKIEGNPALHLSTMIGRYFTMDRDRRWERVRKGYELMTQGLGTHAEDPLAAIERSYADGVSDEFIEPIALVDAAGIHRGQIADGDSIVLFNFRADRMRQVVAVLSDPTFDGFERPARPRAHLITMTRYHEDFQCPVIFSPQSVHDHLGQVFARNGMRQLRIAETEKYAHVTYFFNGGSDEVSPGEERVLIPSSKVATYDLKPEMSLFELSQRVIEEVGKGIYDVVILNIANPDMVGHTGVMNAAVRAVETTDLCLSQILKAVTEAGGVALVTADHGNCELMFDLLTGQPHTAHTSNPVPLILEGAGPGSGLRPGGALENVAPTILEILGIPQPAAMTASSLLMRRTL